MKPGLLLLGLLWLTACRSQGGAADTEAAGGTGSRLAAAVSGGHWPGASGPEEFVGFDRNLYPGDNRLAELRKRFAFAGYWLNNPPGETGNTWVGKRMLLRRAGFGFLVLADGRLDAEIKRSKRTPEALGTQDAVEAVGLAKREGFPAGTILFLDQEEGGRLLPEQAAYFFGWTEAVSSSQYVAGAYVSGQAAADGEGADGRPRTITTAEDVREQIARKHLSPVVLWVQQDACPPAPGCTVKRPKLSDSGTLDAQVWQYAQSPRRPELTRACAATYAADGQCYAGVTRDLSVDLNVADSADPSHGR